MSETIKYKCKNNEVYKCEYPLQVAKRTLIIDEQKERIKNLEKENKILQILSDKLQEKYFKLCNKVGELHE